MHYMLAETVHSRKLQTSGGSTYIVSLPKTWIDLMSLGKGDNITMIENANRSITIHPNTESKDMETATISVGTKDSDESIRRMIVSIYLAGYKSIRIVAGGIRLGPGQINAIRALSRSSFIGTEIVESDEEHITMRILTDMPELTIDTTLRRMRIMTTEIHRESMAALRSGSQQYAQEVAQLDDEIDRFTFYMLRNLTMSASNSNMLYRMSLGSTANCMYYRAAISCIERIADHAALIAKRVKYLIGPIDEDTMSAIANLSEQFIAVFEKVTDALIDSNYSMGEDVFEAAARIERMQEEMMMSVRDTTYNASIIKLVLESIRRSAEYATDIAEVIIDKNIKSMLDMYAAIPKNTIPQ